MKPKAKEDFRTPNASRIKRFVREAFGVRKSSFAFPAVPNLVNVSVEKYESKISPFQSHLDLAHTYWKSLVQAGDTVIDATCGNGQDTLFLAKLCLNDQQGLLYAIDILPKR